MEANSLEQEFLSAARSFAGTLEHAVTDLLVKFEIKSKAIFVRAAANASTSELEIAELKQTIARLEAEKEHQAEAIAFWREDNSIISMDKASMEEEISTLRASVDKLRCSGRQGTATYVSARNGNTREERPAANEPLNEDTIAVSLFTGSEEMNEVADHANERHGCKRHHQPMLETQDEVKINAKKMKHEQSGDQEERQPKHRTHGDLKIRVDEVETQDHACVSLLEAIKRTKPWDKMFANSPNFSHTFDYEASSQAVKNWVNKVRTVQSVYRQGYWAQMHHRKDLSREFDGQITATRRAYRELCREAEELIGSGVLSDIVLTEPFFWRWHTNPVFVPEECNSMSDLEALDEDMPFRLFYTNNIEKHHFYEKKSKDSHVCYLFPDRQLLVG